MPDLKQALRDFVTTANSGRYTTEEELMSKFPELQGYDIQVLRDFVTTANSGRYTDEETLFSKFPEFGFGQQQPTVQPIVKKKDDMESDWLFWDGSSESEPSKTEPEAGLFGRLAQKAFSTKQPQQEQVEPKKELDLAYVMGTDVAQKQLQEKMTPQREEYLTKPLQKIEQKAQFEQKMEKIEEATPEYLRPSIKTIEQSVEKSLENFVGDMNYQFGDAGFEFKDLRNGYFEIKAPDGTSETIRYHRGAEPAKDVVAASVNYFVKTKSAPLKGIERIEKLYKDENKKFATEYQVESELSSLSKEQERTAKEASDFLKRKQEAEAALKAINELPFEKRTANYRDDKFQAEQILKRIYEEGAELQKKIDAIPEKQKNLEIAVGRYNSKQEKQGTWVGGIYNSMLSFVDNTIAGFTDIATDYVANFNPLSGYMTAEQKDKLAKDIKYGTEDELTFMEASRNAFRNAFGDKNTTEQWEALTKQSFIGGAVLGAAEFVPSMLIPGAWFRRAAMYASVNDMVNQEFENNPELQNISENEKLFVKVPIGIVGAVLEEYGVKSIVQNTALVKSITGRAILKATEGMAPAAFKKVVSNEISEMIADGTLRILGGGIMEFETGAAQQGVDITVKSIFNAAKGKKLFDTPDTIVEIGADMALAGAQEMIGSVAVSTPMVVASAYRKKDIAGIPSEYFNVFVESASDKNAEKAFIATLKNNIISGDMTNKEAVELLNNYRNSVGLLQSIPPELNNQEKKQAMSLLRERKELESKTEGKDPALVKPIQNRITQINEQLTKLTEDAIQKQAQAAQEQPAIPAEISNLRDDETVTFTVKSLDEIPEEFRDRASKKEGVEVEVRNTILGLPIGPKKTKVIGEAFTYSLTGKEAKDYAIQKQAASQVSVQPETGAGQEVEVGGTEAKPKITPEESKRKEDLLAALEDPKETEVLEDGKPFVYIKVGEYYTNKEMAQSELDAIIAKEQAAVTEQGGMEQAPTKLTPEESERKQALEEELEWAAKAMEGGLRLDLDGIYVQGKIISLEDARAELDALNQKEQAAPAEGLGAQLETVSKEEIPTEGLGTQLEMVAKEEQTPAEVILAEQFTEQDRSRKAELEEAMRKADKRRKNITVGETTMPKAEAKAELDALVQKEQAAQQPVAVEVAPAEVTAAEVVERTPEQEADLLEELLTGKKKEPTVTETVTPTAQPTVTPTTNKQKITVYRGTGRNVKTGTNENLLWVAEDKKVAENYAEEGNVEEIEIEKPSNPYKLPNRPTYMKGSDIGMMLIRELQNLYKAKKITLPEYESIRKDIDAFISNAGDNTELFTSKINNEKASIHFVNALQKMGFDGISVNESYFSDSPFTSTKTKEESITYGLFKTPTTVTEVKEEEVVSEKPKTKKSNKTNTAETKKADKEKPAISNVVPTSEKTSSTAASLGGVAYELPGGIAIIQVFNLFGQPIYIGYKNGTYTRIDIDSFDNKNNVFTEKELNDLKNLKKEIENQENKNQSDSKNPFTEQGRVAATDSVPNNIKQFVENLTKALGINKKIFIITDNDFNEGQYKKHGLFGTLAAIRSAILGAKNPFEFGSKRYMSDADAYYIYYDGKLKGSELFSVVSHEIGHIIEQELFKNASKETVEAIKNDYNNWVAKLTGKTLTEVQNETRDITIQHLLQGNVSMFDPSVHKYISSFSEYLADNVAKWARTSQKPKTLVDKFFSNLVNEFKKIRDYVFKTGNYSENIFKWLDELYDVKSEKEITTPKSLADAVRKNLKIKGPDGLQSNILGILPAIWNAGVETMAKAIEAGVAINEAVQKAIEYIRENHGKKFNEASVEKKLLIGQYKGAIEIAREAKVTNEGLKTYFKRQGLTDAQIDALLKFKEKAEKKPISKEKVIGKPKPKKVTVNEMTALKDQLRLEAKAAREAKGDLNAKRKMLTDAINKMEKKGSITARQAKALINRVNAVNLDNPVMVERLLDYAEKVFNDAAYAEKLSQANKLQSQIKQLSKNKEKFGNLTAFAAEFAKIDPTLVEDIDEYIEMASNVKEGVQGSKVVGEKVIPADMVDVGKTMEYVNKTMEAQEETIRLKTAERLQELMGVDVSDLTYDQMMELLEQPEGKDISDEKERVVRGFINKMFNTYSTIIKDMFDTGVDPFSDPENPTTVDFKESDKKIVEEFMGMDLKFFDTKEALRAADALNNFLTNKSTAGMVSVLGEYNGRKNAREVNDKKVRAKPIKMYWSGISGKSYFQQIASIPLFFERLFKSKSIGNYVREKMGLNSLINHKSEAVTAANRVINNYVLEFSKKKPNNKKFQDLYNIIERGIIGDLAKTIVGDAKQVEAEFNRRKKLIEESIQILEKGGTKKEKKQAKIMKEVYDNIAKDAKTIEEVKAKADKINVDAVQFWVDTWAKLYDQFADVALNVYNRVLDKNVNYVPDRFGFLERAEKVSKDADGFESMFFANSNVENFYKKESGSLMKSTPPQTLFNKKGQSDMYVNLSFDTNNANALMEALIDIKTAADIRQIQAFKNSPEFDDIIPDGNDASLTKERIATLIRNIRNKRIITDKSFKRLVRFFDRLSSLGTALALAGPTQAISQTLPVAVNTFVNSGGKLNLSNISKKDVNNFINNSGMAIANRGVEAATELESLNQKLEAAATTKVEVAARAIESINRKYLKIYLSNFDVFIARASWITYYEKGLRKQGIKGKVDYSTDKLNKEAAQYAQDMLDRQQNISDKDLAGQLYQSDNPWKQFIVKVVMPLTTFRMNQTTRLSNDVAILISKTSSTEEKKEAAVSLGGFAAEMATFRLAKLYIGYAIFYQLAQFIRGVDEDEEDEEKKWNNMKKGAATSIVTDVFSPIPQTDMPTKYLFSAVMDQLQGIAGLEEEDRFNIFTETQNSFASDYGLLGIAPDKMLKLYNNVQLARTGKFKDDFGNEKTLAESDRALLSDPFYMGLSVATTFGINPFSPETDNVMNNITKMAKKNAMSNEQLKEAEELGVGGKKDLMKVKAEKKANKEEAYGGYKTLEEFEKKEPEKFDEYSAPGGKLDKYREQERKEDEEKNKDQPFRGLSEKKFKELYPEEWRKYYGPGTAYFRKQNSPAMLQKKAQEKMREAQREQKRKMAEVKRKQQEAIRKASGK